MLARNGFLTYATMRNPEKGKNLKSLAEKENSPLRVVRRYTETLYSQVHETCPMKSFIE